MEALTEWSDDPTAAERVFEYASPANRAVTGPLDRFRGMVKRKPYDALIGNCGWIAGTPMIAGDAAIVLVTLIDSQNDLRAYRFYLSRQPSADGVAWMTDGVIALPLLRPSGGSQDVRPNSDTI